MKHLLVSLAMVLVAVSSFGQALTSNVMGLTIGRIYSESTAKNAIKGSRVASTRTEADDIAIKGTFKLLDFDWTDIILLGKGKYGIVFRYNCADDAEAKELFKTLIPAADAAYSKGQRLNDTAYMYEGEGGGIELMMQILPTQKNTISLYYTKN